MNDDVSARLIGSAFVGAGIAHFTRPDFFEAIVPRWFPSPKAANQVSGAAEIALGLGMFSPRTRRPAAIGLLGLLAAVFPANVDMAIHDVAVKSDDDGRIVRVENADGARAPNLIRLPFQALFAWFVWRHARPAQQQR